MLVEKTIHHAFPARAGGCFTLDADSGLIAIGPGEGDEIRVEVTVAARAKDDAAAQEILELVELGFLETGPGPVVRSRAAKAERHAWGFWRRRGQVALTFSIAIPGRQDVVVKTDAGDVEVTRIQGDVSVRTGAGSIRVRAIEGQVKAETAAGDVTLLQIGGAIEVVTGAGEVSAEIVRQPAADSSITTKVGSVSIDLAETLGLYLDAATKIGEVITRLPSVVRTSRLGGSLCAPVNGGGPRLTVRTAVGEVSLRSFVPA